MRIKLLLGLFIISIDIFAIWESKEFKNFTDSSSRVESSETYSKNYNIKNGRNYTLGTVLPYFKVKGLYYSSYKKEIEKTSAIELLKEDFHIETRDDLLLKVNYIFDKGFRFTWLRMIKQYPGKVTHQSLFIRDFYTVTVLLVLGYSSELIDEATLFKYVDSIPGTKYIGNWEKFNTFLVTSFYLDNIDKVRQMNIAISHDRATGKYPTTYKGQKSHEHTKFNMDFNFSEDYIHNEFRVITPVKDLVPEGEFINHLGRYGYLTNAIELYNQYTFKDEILWNGQSYIHYFTLNRQTGVLNFLLESGFDPNKEGSNRETGFSVLIKKDRESDDIPLFLKHGANPLLGFIYDFPILAYVIRQGGSFYLDLMLEGIDNLDFVAIKDWHYIHLAARYLDFNDFEMVYKLCNNLTVRTSDNHSALDLARSNKSYDSYKIVELLESKM